MSRLASFGARRGPTEVVAQPGEVLTGKDARIGHDGSVVQSPTPMRAIPNPSETAARARRADAGWLLAAAVAVLAGGLAAQDVPTKDSQRRLRSVRIVNEDVFEKDEAEQNLLYRIANGLHATTSEDVVRREIWFTPGATVSGDEVEELERNLRGFGIFGAVETETTPVGDDEFDLLVRTRDRFSFAASASVASVGGVEKLNFRLAESNLFGTGKTVAASAKHSDEGSETYLRYYDRQFLGSWHVLDVRVGDTDEGHLGSVELSRPLHHLEDPAGYALTFDGIQEDVDYYRYGDSWAEVPMDSTNLALSGVLADGPRDRRHQFGLDVRTAVRDYEPATGSGAAEVRVPGDTSWVEVGGSAGIDHIDAYEKVTGLDTLDYVQDLWLGKRVTVRAAGRLRDEENVGTALQPLLGTRAQVAVRPLDQSWFTLEADATLRAEDEQAVGWRGSTALHAYQTSIPANTLAASLTFDLVREDQDLEPQLTLGEDNGLRGYPAREFTGTRRVRLNLEDRFDTGIQLWSFRLGLAAFFDAGWIHDRDLGLSLGDSIRSAGVGIRLGSSHFLGGRILRLDVAYPFDEVLGEDYGISVSFTTDQVFTWFGNASELGSAF